MGRTDILDEFIEDDSRVVRLELAKLGYGIDILCNDPDDEIRDTALEFNKDLSTLDDKLNEITEDNDEENIDI